MALTQGEVGRRTQLQVSIVPGLTLVASHHDQEQYQPDHEAHTTYAPQEQDNDPRRNHGDHGEHAFPPLTN